MKKRAKVEEVKELTRSIMKDIRAEIANTTIGEALAMLSALLFVVLLVTVAEKEEK